MRSEDLFSVLRQARGQLIVCNFLHLLSWPHSYSKHVSRILLQDYPEPCIDIAIATRKPWLGRVVQLTWWIGSVFGHVFQIVRLVYRALCIVIQRH